MEFPDADVLWYVKGRERKEKGTHGRGGRLVAEDVRRKDDGRSGSWGVRRTGDVGIKEKAKRCEKKSA